MNLYREVKIEELLKQIEKSKEKVSHLMNNREAAKRFKSEYDKGNFQEAISMAAEDIERGYRYVIGELVQYDKAKTMIENGEKIFTLMLDTELS